MSLDQFFASFDDTERALLRCACRVVTALQHAPVKCSQIGPWESKFYQEVVCLLSTEHYSTPNACN